MSNVRGEGRGNVQAGTYRALRPQGRGVEKEHELEWLPCAPPSRSGFGGRSTTWWLIRSWWCGLGSARWSTTGPERGCDDGQDVQGVLGQDDLKKRVSQGRYDVSGLHSRLRSKQSARAKHPRPVCVWESQRRDGGREKRERRSRRHRTSRADWVPCG